MRAGVVCDALNSLARPTRAELGPTQIVRLTAHWDEALDAPHPELEAYVRDLRTPRADLAIALVLARESFPGPRPRSRTRRLMEAYLRRLQPDYLIVGNECDAGLLRQPPSASWMMSHGSYAQLWADAITALQRADAVARTILVGAGQASGNPEWIRELLPHLPAEQHPARWDLHCYTTAPEELQHLLGIYQTALPEVQFCVFEWNHLNGVLGNYARMLDVFQRSGIEACTFFGWSNSMAFEADGSRSELGLVDFPEIQAEVFDWFASHPR